MFAVIIQTVILSNLFKCIVCILQLFALKKEWRLLPQVSRTTNHSQDRGDTSEDEDDPDIAKIKKVQSFFRGWLCRRRWKQIVDEYIRSPHAESMRKRNW